MPTTQLLMAGSDGVGNINIPLGCLCGLVDISLGESRVMAKCGEYVFNCSGEGKEFSSSEEVARASRTTKSIRAGTRVGKDQQPEPQNDAVGVLGPNRQPFF